MGIPHGACRAWPANLYLINRAGPSGHCIIALLWIRNGWNEIQPVELQGNSSLRNIKRLECAAPKRWLKYTAPEIIGVKICNKQTDKYFTLYTDGWLFFLLIKCYNPLLASLAGGLVSIFTFLKTCFTKVSRLQTLPLITRFHVKKKIQNICSQFILDRIWTAMLKQAYHI